MEDISVKEVVVLDFETTGLSAGSDRTIEVGAVLIEDGSITQEFSHLMNPGFSIPYFISDITGITDEMVEEAPMPEEVMPLLSEFVGDRLIVAHNASFDQRFYFSEMNWAGFQVENPFLCTMLLARRLVHTHNHKLSTLSEFYGIEAGCAHRALDDARATAQLWIYLMNEIRERSSLENIEFELLRKILKKPKAQMTKFFRTLRKTKN